MGIIAPQTISDSDTRIPARKSFADTKRWLSNEFYQCLNQFKINENGERLTNAQAMVQGIVDMAVDPEKDDYVRLAASKFIIEHMEGKASAMTEEKHEEMPQIVINVGNVNMNNIQNNIASISSPQPKEDVIDEITTDFEEAK